MALPLSSPTTLRKMSSGGRLRPTTRRRRAPEATSPSLPPAALSAGLPAFQDCLARCPRDSTRLPTWPPGRRLVGFITALRLEVREIGALTLVLTQVSGREWVPKTPC